MVSEWLEIELNLVGHGKAALEVRMRTEKAYTTQNQKPVKKGFFKKLWV